MEPENNSGNQKLRNSYDLGQMDTLHTLPGWNPNAWTPNNQLDVHVEVFEKIPLKCRISSDMNDMDKLNAIHGWTPSRTMIRPSPDVIQDKHNYLEEVNKSWISHEDYILHHIFGKAPVQNNEGRNYVPNKGNMIKMKRFERNHFRYDLPEGTRHFVMWYTYWPPEITEPEVNEDINQALITRLGKNTEFEFIWYENPKMTIPGIYHVQVFWRIVTIHS